VVQRVRRDITERKQIEIALRDSGRAYRTLFESTPQPIWVYDEVSLAFLAVTTRRQKLTDFHERIPFPDNRRIRLSEGLRAC